MPNFEVEIGGNIAPITRTLQELKSDLKVFKLELEHASDPISVIKLNAALKQTEDEIKRIRNIGPIIPPSATNSIAAAGNSLQNVGRIAQDLPFGFIGIQNNLNPLLESFQRLRQETGSNSAALKAMGSSLIGAGGIGLALSIVSSAIVIYQNGIAGFNKKTKEAKDAAEDFAKTLKTVADVIGDATSGQTGGIAQVQALADVIKDTNISYKERKRALEELKEVNKNFFGDITLESKGFETLTDRVNEYTKAIVAQAVVKGFTDEISRVSVEVAKQDRALEASRANLGRLKGSLKTATEELGKLSGGAGDFARSKMERLQQQVEEAEDAFTAQRDVVENLATNYALLSGQIDEATRNTLKLRNLNAPGADKKEVDLLKQRLEALERIKKITQDVDELAGLQESIFELQVKIAVRDQGKNQMSAKELELIISGYRKQLDEAFKNQAIALEGIPKIKFSPVAMAEIPKQITDRISKATGNEKIVITLHNVRVRFLGEKQTKLIEDKEKINEQLSREINDSFQNLQIDFATTIGEQLGEQFASALQGGDLSEGLKNAARAMLSVLGSTMQQIGKYVISAAIKIKLLKETLEKFAVKNPAIAIVAGIGLIAAGAALKNATFQGPKFAQGGIVTGPTIGLVGEAGKEAIIPLNKLSSMIGSPGATTVVLKGSLGIRGREIVAFLEQETNRFNRIR